MNENELLTPDYLFEVSWEVCNKVGGIHTVVSTKARTVESKLGDNYLLIGPDIQREGDNPEFEEDDELLKAWRQSVYNDGIRIRIGRWRVVGRPIAVLDVYKRQADDDAEQDQQPVEHPRVGLGAQFAVLGDVFAEKEVERCV